MSEEEIKKIAKEEFMNNVMEHLNGVLIFTYIQNLEIQLQQKENIIKKVREYNEEILKESWYGGNEKKYAKHNLEILDKENK